VPRPKPLALPRQVVALGWVSLLTDFASEMIYPFLPELLRRVGGGAAALGLVEGCAEAVAAVCKLGSGVLSDRLGRRKPFAIAGYGLAAIVRPLLGLVSAPWQVVAIRSADRIGKGVRGPPRDALLSESVDKGSQATAFGVQRMMDNLGAAIGPVVAFLLIHFAGLDLRTLFLLSIFPGVLSVGVLAGAVREGPSIAPGQKLSAPSALPVSVRRFFLAFALFSLAGSTDAFLLLRLLDLGFESSFLPLAWVSLQLAKSLLNWPGGKASDRYGHRRMLLFGWTLYAAAYACFAWASTLASFFAVMLLYAAYYGLTEGAQRAVVAEMVPSQTKARAFGMMLALEGAMVLPANVLFGWAYQTWGARAAFAGGAAVAFAAVIALKLDSRSRPRTFA
jgi:MFS family permease